MDNETNDLLTAIGRAIEEQARATRYVNALGFVAVVAAIIIF
jgi:hypothetical protein